MRYSELLELNFRSDIPTQNWLDGKIRSVEHDGLDPWGVPRMGTITGYFDESYQLLPIGVAAKVRGARKEQDSVRSDSIEWLTDFMSKHNRFPRT